ncbi:AraC-like DNA-binding protein [Kribbella orskensis]|uniref:AraC-like DNA-binding protein n=1 Tax=Kribbella orskensis TaxID=2512216 RepID=A0ABY2BBP9_9ACTN|nr:MULTISPECIES: AraC family transcriptional regulator [Kribbella]TCN34771.1 AraC-like DNA-binding protein [Kribbella sp. VKM Ac-2500]TCO15476.1 AraC-like DNA-binding protein [Kribbella orskensis]
MVSYLRVPPPAEQRDFVEHYWMVEAPGSPSEVKREILIPNGRPGLAIALAEPGLRQDPVTGHAWTNDASLFGIMTRPHVLTQTGMACYVGAEFKPWGIAALGLADRLVDAVLPLARWTDPGTAERLAGELVGLEFGQPRADRLAEFVGSRLRDVRALDVVDRAVKVIEEARGALSVAEVAGAVGVSYSSLYRIFTGLTGLGPKQFGEIVRYFHFVGGLLGGPADAASTLAALHGYYDQAHAARDFKRFTGVSATSFRAVQNGIAALMHGRSVQDSAPGTG